MVAAVCRLAFDFYSQGNFIIFELVRLSGYPRQSRVVTIDRLRECLAEHPDWLNAWLEYSEDKRTSSGWYVVERDRNEFLVGYIPESPGREQVVFHDKVQACAEYVHREIADMAGLDPESSRLDRWISRLMTRG